jgi:hypothetical protein
VKRFYRAIDYGPLTRDERLSVRLVGAAATHLSSGGFLDDDPEEVPTTLLFLDVLVLPAVVRSRLSAVSGWVPSKATPFGRTRF